MSNQAIHPAMRVAGYHEEALGIGEVARRMTSLLYGAGLNVERFQLPTSLSQRDATIRSAVNETTKKPRCYCLISVVNPDQVAFSQIIATSPGDKIHLHAGVWSWELEDVPKFFNRAAIAIDQIWTYSEFMHDTFSKSIDADIKKFQMYSRPTLASKGQARAAFNLGQKTFTCVVVFDFFSDLERKNPWGSINAYLKAFPKPDMATLIVKTINADRFADDFRKLQLLSNSRKDIKIIDGYFSEREIRSLIKASDVFLSLHRSEGFGFNLFDALTDGVPVIATNYSGNLDYMARKKELLVNFDFVEVEEYGNYQISSKWAEPDVDHAAKLINELYNSPASHARLASSLSEELNETFSYGNAVEKMKGLLDAIR